MFHACPAWIGPSLLACDLSKMADEANRVLVGGADYLHLDVMDGHFVPNMTFGAPVIKCLRKNVPNDAFLDVHLMVSHPEQWLNDMAEAGANSFIFHIEATNNPKELITKIKELKMKAGIAIKPATPVEVLYEFEEFVDCFLIMTVEPGFGGQKFMHNMMDKVRALRKQCPTIDIGVDGGLGPSTIDEAALAGANQIVAGSAVFLAPNPAEVISSLRRSIEKHGHGKQDSELSPLVR